ncbi:MAG: dynamin family protein [Candidatus Cryptobacteroides sp.]|nr:dynamin family protein [Candidatus Cryptobacteroides sp.]
MEINRLIQISDELGFGDLADKLHCISTRMGSHNCPIVLPLVGEFSAGKTTLLNALTDNKQLETATIPTTATIYEVNFASDSCRAEVYDREGNLSISTDAIQDLKNGSLADASLVKVFDTSTVIPSSVVLVDTPGLSAPDPRHRQALVDYLPNADGILLVSDINQQITSSLIDFTKTVSLANRPVFCVLTMCDLKSPSDVKAAKRYAESLLGIPEDHIVCVSAKTGDVQSLCDLIGRIQQDKSEILDKVNKHRVKTYANQIAANIDKILSSSKFEDANDELVSDNQRLVNKIKREVDSIIDSVRGEIEDVSRQSTRNFETVIFDQLDSLAANTGIDFDFEARTLVDNVIRIQFNDYKNKAKRIICQKAKKGFNADPSVSLDGVLSINVDAMQFESIPYNLNLNELGHEHDGKIAAGLKVAAAVAATAAVVVTAGAASPAAGTVAAGAKGTGKAIEAADMVLDAGSMVMSASVLSKLRQGAEFAGKVQSKYKEIDAKDYSRNQNGAFRTFIGSITDRTLGKPQRRRAIHEYLDYTLLPSYRQGLESITTSIVSAVSESISESVETSIQELTSAIAGLQREMRDNKDEYNKRVSRLKQYKSEILGSI